MTGKRNKTAVLIVGAGPTGLSAAIELARYGKAVRIIDRDSGPTPLSKAVAVNARSLELLEPSGLTDKLISAGVKMKSVHIHAGTKPLVTLNAALIRHRFNFLLALPQSETEQVMAAHLNELGVQVEREKEFVALEQTPQNVRAVVKAVNGGAEETIEAGYLLAADGAHSAVRKNLGIGFPGGQYKYDWNLVDVVLDSPYAHDEANVFSWPGGRVLLVIPIGRGRHRLISTTSDAVAMLPPPARVKEKLWESDFHVSHRLAGRFNEGRVFLAGDAAHIHSPAGGRGMNLGIEDGCEFAFRLVRGGLETYGVERREVARKVIRQTDMFFRMGAADNAVLMVLRNAVMPLVMGNARIQSAALTAISGIAPGRRLPPEA